MSAPKTQSTQHPTESPTINGTAVTPAALRRRLLGWYDRRRRKLPWRAEPGETPDPYRIWLSEIMLQQTTVATVRSYFQAFLERWPTVERLAEAPLDDVLHAWQGLGYYARARNLHRCAQTVVSEHGGVFPDTEDALRALPGIGDYTAAAVAALAFGRKAAPVDGNIMRVIARLFAIPNAMPEGKARVQDRLAPLVPARRAGDFAQALMDLGAMVCTPRTPACGACPVRSACRALADGDPRLFPVKKAKRAKPTRRGVAYWITLADGTVLLRRRAESGLLGGMMEVPTSEWRERDWPLAEAKSRAPVKAAWTRVPGSVRHTFTHFHLELTVLTAEIERRNSVDGVWCPAGRLGDYALPTVMKKIAALAESETAPGK
ncbi:MAG: A/G-specific adenine glycosylase [Rhodospirillales bacterium]